MLTSDMKRNFNSIFLLSALAVPMFSSATSLKEAAIAAFSFDSSLQSNRATAKADKQKYWQGMSGMLPTVSMEGGWSRQEQPNEKYQSGVTRHTYSIEMRQPIFDMSKVANWKKGDAIAIIAETQLFLSQQKLITDVADAYFTVLHQQEVLQAARSASHTFKSQLIKLESGLHNGQNTRTDVDEARANYDLALAKDIQASNDLLLAGESFRKLTGTQPEGIEPVNFQCIPIESRMSLTEAVSKAQNNNVEVKLAELQTVQANADLFAANAAHLPTVSAYASYGKNWSRNDDDDNVLYDAIFGTKSKSSSMQYGISVSIPLFSGGGQLSQSLEAAYRKEAAKDNIREAKRKAIQDARSAWLSIKNGAALVEAQKNAVNSAKQKVKSIEYERNMGLRTINDQLDAQQRYYESLRDYSEARFRFLDSVLQLSLYTGSLDINALDMFQCN